MREIVFRGKRVKPVSLVSQWIYGNYVFKADNSLPGLSKHFIVVHDGFGVSQWIAVEPDTVGQYTGLKDKNGRMIFEGDIVAQNWYDYDEPIDDSFGEVVFCEVDCSFSVMDANKDEIMPFGRCHAYHWEAEIIGNIHDNPERFQ